MANLRRFRGLAFIFCVAVCAAACATSAQPAKADLLGLGGLIGSNCPRTGLPVFAPWGDPNLYYLAPNGGLESGSNGWTLRNGASVVSGNEPYYPTGTHSLSLPSGSTATSPVVCIGPKDVTIRMFASDEGGTDQGLHVRVLWYGLLNQLLGSSDFDTFDGGGSWRPSSTVDSTGGFNLLLPILGSTSARVQLTPIGGGSNWRMDDLFVDPWLTGW